MNTWFLNKMISLKFSADGANGIFRDYSKKIRDGANEIGTIQNFSGRDIQDSGHEKVCLAGLYVKLSLAMLSRASLHNILSFPKIHEYSITVNSILPNFGNLSRRHCT